ncbi:MAG TPA: NADH-quinone oxidoreductase subunit H, partial [Candidatus Angelobacter sp.]
GPQLGFLPPLAQSLLPVVYFALKVFFFIFLYIWIRGTLPRFRYDQVMTFGWKFLLPLAIANIIVTSLIVAWGA